MRRRSQKTYTLSIRENRVRPGPGGDCMPKIEVDANKCKACYLCVNACPKKCLGKSKTISKKGYFPAEQERPEDCIGCKMCYLVCPDVAITVIK